MLVRELMERTNISNFGVARMFIEDAMIDMSIKQAPWQRELDIGIIKDVRFYDIPVDCIKITDILIKNHMNSKGEYRSIPRLLNEPKNKDIAKGGYEDLISGSAPHSNESSDLNTTVNTKNEAGETSGSIDNIGSQAMEYGYYMKGNRIAIVEKALYQDPNADVTNDINAYQRSNYDWRSPSVNNLSGIKIRYAYKPVYYMNRTGSGHVSDSSGRNYAVQVFDFISKESGAYNISSTGGFNEVTEYLIYCVDRINNLWEESSPTFSDFTVEPKLSNYAAGKWIWLENVGFFSGLWEITRCAGADHAVDVEQKSLLGIRRPIQWASGQSPETNGQGLPITSTLLNHNIDEWRRQSLVITNINTLYTDQEDFNLPVSDLQSRAIICFIKAQMALEAGNIEVKEYFEKEYETKLAQQETAYVTGPRMISAGPFALK